MTPQQIHSLFIINKGNSALSVRVISFYFTSLVLILTHFVWISLYWILNDGLSSITQHKLFMVLGSLLYWFKYPSVNTITNSAGFRLYFLSFFNRSQHGFNSVPPLPFTVAVLKSFFKLKCKKLLTFWPCSVMLEM